MHFVDKQATMKVNHFKTISQQQSLWKLKFVLSIILYVPKDKFLAFATLCQQIVTTCWRKKKKKKEPSMFKHALNKTNEQGLYVPAIQYSACLQQQNRLYF